MNDYGCPTCGSKNFGTVEMKKNGEGALLGKNSAIIVKNFGTVQIFSTMIFCYHYFK